MLDRLTSGIDFQGQALTLRAERQRLLASNIANADTPGYVAQEMDFARALRSATTPVGGELKPGGAGPARPSAHQPGHIPLNGSEHLGRSTLSLAAEGRAAYAQPSQASIDRNTVDMDRERAAFADNSIKFEAALRFINGSVRTMLDAVRGGQ
jgi:flagellar basal-body rod protein FlgB